MKKLLLLFGLIFLAYSCGPSLKEQKFSKKVNIIFYDEYERGGYPYFSMKAAGYDSIRKNKLTASVRLAMGRESEKYCGSKGFPGIEWLDYFYDDIGTGHAKCLSRDVVINPWDRKEEQDLQLDLIGKAKELCTNIGYTPNTDSHRGCIVELMKVDNGGTEVTVNNTNYQDMIDRGICMTTGKCDITGQPIIRKSQNTISNNTCKVTGTGVWKTIQCF